MAPPVAPKNQTPFDDEISHIDIIQFFKTHFKRILFFVIIGGILGYLYGKLAAPIYEGSVLISPAKVAGNLVVDPKITLTHLNMNSYYSKKTFQVCNPMFYKGKDIDYDMSDIVKSSITKDGALIELKMSSPDKETIHACLESIPNDIFANEKTIADLLIESKKIELNLFETKLKLAEEFREQLNDKKIKNLKTNEQRFYADVLYVNIMFNNSSEIKTLLDQINKIKTELSSEQTKEGSLELPISIKNKSPLTPTPYALTGLFWGLCLGIIISLIKQNKFHF